VSRRASGRVAALPTRPAIVSGTTPTAQNVRSRMTVVKRPRPATSDRSGAASPAGRSQRCSRGLPFQRAVSLSAASATCKGDDGGRWLTFDGAGVGRSLATVGWGTAVGNGARSMERG